MSKYQRDDALRAIIDTRITEIMSRYGRGVIPGTTASNIAPIPVSGSAPLNAQYLALAVDATLTAERVFTPGAGLTGTDSGAGAAYTLALTTPGALTVATTNSASGNHTHAVTSSSNPGAAASLLATNASGYLQLTRLGAGVAPSYPLHALATTEQMRLSYDGSNYAAFTVGGGGNLTVAPSGDFLFDPTGNDILPVTNYDLNLGALSRKYLTLHAAELWVETLVAQNTIATIGGRILVGPTTTLTRDLPASASGYATIAQVGTATTATGSGTGITFVAVTATSDRNVFSMSITRPSGTTTNDVLIAVITVSRYGSISTPSGWTLLADVRRPGSTWSLVYYRVAGGSEPASYTWTVDDVDEGVAAIISTYRGVDTASPINASDFRSNTYGADMIAPSITTTVSNTHLVFIGGIETAYSTSLTSTPPSGYTERGDVASSGSGSDARQVAYLADAAFYGSGATGEITATMAENWEPIAGLIALRPANSNTSVTLNVPSGVSNGHVMLATAVYANGTLTVPSGWTLVTSQGGFGVYRRVASGEPASYTWSLNTTDSLATACIAYSNVDTANPVDVSGSQSNGSSTSMTAPTVTTTIATDRLVFLGGAIGGSTTATAPGSMTERADAGTGNANIYIADRALSSAGATGTYTATLAASRANIGALVALRPNPNTSDTVYVRHNQMASGDTAYMEADGKIEFFRVTSSPTTISATEYSYTVTRNLDGTGSNDWYAGDAMFNTGQAGNGFADLYSLYGIPRAGQTSTQRAGPTIVGNVRLSSTFNDIRERWAIGNLNGLYDYGTTVYGFAAGDPTASWIAADATNGLRMMYGTSPRVTIGTTGTATFGDTSGASPNLSYSSATGYLAIRAGTTDVMRFKSTGAIDLIYRPDAGVPRARLNWYNETNEYLATMYGYTAGGDSYLNVEAYPQTSSGTGYISMSARGTVSSVYGASALTIGAQNVRVSGQGLQVGSGSSAIAAGNIYAEGNVTADAGALLPRSSGSELFGIDATGTGGSIVIANNAYAAPFGTPGSGGNFSGLLIVNNVTNGINTLNICGSAVIGQLASAAGYFSTTQGTSGRVNIYYGGGPTYQLTIENLTGASVTLHVFAIRTRASA
jgi:hypothetical protein